jgi:spectinomycin phosphotransferase
MLTPPADISAETIALVLREHYKLGVRQTEFLPLGADLTAAAFRVTVTDGEVYFLKLRRGAFNSLEVALPAWLHTQGVAAVMAPLATEAGALWFAVHGYTWTLYPFFSGENAYHAPLTDGHWRALGATLRRIHGSQPPADLATQLPRDESELRYCDAVRLYDARMESERWHDPLAERLATFWQEQRAEILLVVARAEELVDAVRQRAAPQVLCHGDFHGGNIMLGANDTLTIVDWDAAIFAPKERDFVFVGAPLSGHWDDDREIALFFEGYGAPDCNLIAGAYYRYERIVTDIALFTSEVFDLRSALADRERSLDFFTGQFTPEQDIALAHRAYTRIG